MKSKVTSQTKAIESRDKEIEELQEEKESSLTDLQELQAVCEELKAGMETEKNLSQEAKKEVRVNVLLARMNANVTKKIALKFKKLSLFYISFYRNILLIKEKMFLLMI